MPKPPPGKTLTAKQERFVEEYMIDLNATQAALRAGYSEKTAHRAGSENMQKPAIRVAIAEKQAAVSEEHGITLGYVLRGLSREAEFQGEGASHGARVSAFKALGDHIGAFKQRLEVSGPGGGPVSIQNMTDEQLKEIIATGRRQT